MVETQKRIPRAAWLSSLLFFAAFYALLVVLPVYLASARLDAAAIALVFGAFGAAGLVTRPIAGKVTDRFGALSVVVVGIVLFAGATLGLMWADSLPVLTLLRGGQAAGYVAFTTGATSMVALASDPATHPQVMARYGTAANVAMAGAPVAATALLEYLAPDLLLCGIALVALAAMAFLLGGGSQRAVDVSRTAPPHADETPRSTGRLSNSLLAVVFGVGFGAFLQFMPVFAYQRGRSSWRCVHDLRRRYRGDKDHLGAEDRIGRHAAPDRSLSRRPGGRSCSLCGRSGDHDAPDC